MFRSMLARTRHGKGIACVVAALILVALFIGLGLAQGPRPSKGKEAGSTGAYQTGLEDARKVAGFVEAYGQRIDDAERRMAEREQELKELREHARKLEGAVAQLLGEMERARAPSDVPNGLPSDADEKSRTPSAPPLARLVRVPLAVPGAKAERDAAKTVRLPAGSFAEAKLLTGVYAPIEGGPLPVMLKVDAVFTGPNRSRIPLTGALLIGRAEGEPNSLRVIVQIEKLSYVASDGLAVEVPVNGYIADADGVQGIAGTYVWRVQETAAAAAFAGGLSAAADAAAARETLRQATPLGGLTEAVTGDVARFAAARGGSRAAEALEKTIARRLDQIVPAIHAPNGKTLTVILLEGASLPGVSILDAHRTQERNPYAGLDFDR